MTALVEGRGWLPRLGQRLRSMSKLDAEGREVGRHLTTPLFRGRIESEPLEKSSARPSARSGFF